MNDFLKNEAAYENAPVYVSGIFSYEKNAPIDNWLQRTVQNLSNDRNKLPTDWVQVLEFPAKFNKEWPLLYSLSTERIEKEILANPVATFQFGSKALQNIVI